MISYRVKARLAKKVGSDEFSLEDFEKSFVNIESPIEARKEAFKFYTSIVEILGEGKDDFSIIKDHLDKIGWEKALSLTYDENNPYNFMLGVGIYLIVDKDEVNFYNEEYKDTGSMIIGNRSNFDYLSVALHLEDEMKIYKSNNWGFDNWTTNIKVWDYEVGPDEEEIYSREVLWTPFDFWNHWNPSMAEDEEDEPLVMPQEKSLLEKIIDNGENRKLEFKSSLRVCLREDKPKYYIEKGIIKTINAFANTEGGVLLIGVDDDENVIGLQSDIDSFSNKTKDDFLKHFDNLIKHGFTEPIDAILSFGFEEVNSTLVFLVNVSKSSKPRFLKVKGGGKEFYIRRSASSNILDIEETVNYIIDKWHA